MARITAYRQLENSDCGITCIRIIASYYGKDLPLSVLRKLCDMSRVGISLNEIVNCADAIGLKALPVAVSEDDVFRMPLPAILYWDQEHYVVIYKISLKKNKFYLADPSQGKVVVDKENFFYHWSRDNKKGISVLLAPTSEFYKFECNIQTNSKYALLRLLKSAIKKYKKGFLLVAVFTILSVVADIILPIVFRRTIDEGIKNKDIALVWLLALGQLCIFIGNYIANNVIDIVLTKLGLKISINLINEYLAKLIRLPISFFDRKISSDLIQKIDDQNRIKNFLVNIPDVFFFTFLNIVVFSGLLIHYNYIIFIIVIIGTLLSYGWFRLFVGKRREIDYLYYSYSSKNRNNIYELINGIHEIKINNAQKNRVDIWEKTQKKINRLSLRSALLEFSINSGNTLISRVKDISITGLCATLVIKNQMTIGTMMTISYIVGRLTNPISSLISSLTTIQDASFSYERLDEVINQSSQEIDSKKTKVNFYGHDKTLYFQNVSFKYPGSFSPLVIHNVTTKIPYNKVTAIVGSSGSGKTTLIKLMLGFYSPQNGELHIGKYRMSELDNDLWLKHCGVVMQSGYIFSGTILENIGLSDSIPDLLKAKKAATIASIDTFIEGLPMGYYTKIGVNGIDLSGGQKQRLYIARAIYKNPDFLFLDEATSSLDANNEIKIINNLKDYYKERTVIISAHRLSTIKNADKIIYMNDGMIIEEGTHDELIELKGQYYKLVKNQLDLSG